MSANAVRCGWQGCPFPGDSKHPIHTEGWHPWTPVESDPEPVPEVPAAKSGASASIRHVVMRLAMSDPDVDQDARDGEALRLLREALPNGWDYGLTWYGMATVSAGDGGDGWYTEHGGRTIAEAADECRKVLEARR